MRLKIVQAGEPVLRQDAAELTKAEIKSREIQELIAAMRETMYDAPGVGLAAPQVGLPLRLAVIEDKAEYLRDLSPDTLRERERVPVPFHVIINPRIVSYGSAQAEFFEGCLSVTGYSALVRRSVGVRVEYLDHAGEPGAIEASGWYARILQHEIDHLNGVLYTDRMMSRSFMTVENMNRHWKSVPLDEINRLLDINRD